MRERALERDDNPTSPPKASTEVFFVSGARPARHQDMTTTINTDLLTPLGAYLRLRDAGSASFILESVERGRLGRNSWMGAGSRIVDFDEAADARAADRRLPRLRPRGEARADGAAARRRAAASRRAASSSARRSSASTTAPASPRCSPAIAEEIAGRLEAGIPWRREPRGTAGPISRSPDRGALHRDGRAREGAHRGRRRLPVRPLAAGRAADLRLAARHLPRPPARQPVALPLPARARRDRARRLLARAARRLRERPRQLLPDRRHDRAHRRRRRAAALLREGPRRARDARRPRPQRPLARLQGGHRARRARHGGGAVLARLAPGLGGRRRAARRRHAVRRPPRLLPGRHRHGRAEGARDAADLRAGGVQARPVRRRRAVLAPGWDDGRLHRAAHDGDRRGRRLPAGGRRRRLTTPTRRPSTRSA